MPKTEATKQATELLTLIASCQSGINKCPTCLANIEVALKSVSSAAAKEAWNDARAQMPLRLDFIEKILQSLKVCSEDLQASVDAEYAGTQDLYPSVMRKYQRDIKPVTDARGILSEYQKLTGRVI